MCVHARARAIYSNQFDIMILTNLSMRQIHKKEGGEKEKKRERERKKRAEQQKVRRKTRPTQASKRAGNDSNRNASDCFEVSGGI